MGVQANRRAILAGVPLAAMAVAVPVAASPAQSTLADRWREFIEGQGQCHRNMPAAVLNAMNAGLDPDNCTSIQLTGRHARPDQLPALIFEEANGSFVVVNPIEARRWSPVQ